MMIEIDGSAGEGGGQILRTSLSLSAITGEDIKVFNIRAKRPNPGLRAQHLTAVKAMAEICNAKVEGARIGSKEIIFRPGNMRGGMFRFDVGTAGSITLVLQAILPPLLVAEKESVVKVIGGTDVKWAPQINYFSDVFLQILSMMGTQVSLRVMRRGYYPEGGGEVNIEIKPTKLSPLDISSRVGSPLFGGLAHTQNLPDHVAERMVRTAAECLGVSEENIKIDRRRGRSTGAGIVLWAKYPNTILGADSLGERGVPAEIVAKRCCLSLKEELNSDATVDIHMSDQLMVYGALSSRIIYTARELTNHAKTNAEVLKKFGIDVKIERKENLYLFRIGSGER